MTQIVDNNIPIMQCILSWKHQAQIKNWQLLLSKDMAESFYLQCIQNTKTGWAWHATIW